LEGEQVLLARGEQALLVLLFQAVSLLASGGHNPLLIERHHDVINTPSGTGHGGVVEAEALQAIKNNTHVINRMGANHLLHNGADLFAVNLFIEESEVSGQVLVEEDAAHRGLNHLALGPAQLGRVISHHLDFGPDIDLVELVGGDRLARAAEVETLTLSTLTD